MERGEPTSSGRRRTSSSRLPEVLDPLQAQPRPRARDGCGTPATSGAPRPRDPPRKGSGKPAERQELLQIAGRAQAQLGHGEGMQAQEVIAALQRVAAEAVEVEARAARDQDALAAAPAVVEALQVPAPGAVLVDLVEDPQPRGGSSRRRMRSRSPATSQFR